MARNRLTWQNVNAPDYGSTMTGMAAANKMFQDALGGLSTSLGDFATNRKNAQDEALLKQQQEAEGAYLRQMASVLGDTEREEAVRRGLSENTLVGNDFIGKQLTDFRNAQLTGNTTAESLRRDIFNNEVSQREQLAREAVQPLQARLLQQYASGDEKGAQQTLAAYESLVAQLSLEDQEKLFNAGSTQAGDWQSRRTSETDRRRTNQEMYQSGVRFSNDQTDRTESRTAQALAQSIANATPNTSQRMELVAGIEDPIIARQVQKYLTEGFANEYLGDERPTYDPGPTEYDAAIAGAERNLGRVTNLGGMGEHIKNLDALANDTRTPMQVVKELRESAPDFFNKYSDGQIQDGLRAVQAESKNNLNFGQAAYLAGSNLTNIGWELGGLNWDETQDNNIVGIIRGYLNPQAGNIVERSARAEQGRQLLTSAQEEYQRAVAELRQAEARNADPRALAALQERERLAGMRVTDILRQVNEGAFGEAPVMEGGEVNTPSVLRKQAANRAENARQEAASKEQKAAQAREQLPSLRLELELALYERRRNPTKENSDRVVALQRQIRDLQEALQ